MIGEVGFGFKTSVSPFCPFDFSKNYERFRLCWPLEKNAVIFLLLQYCILHTVQYVHAGTTKIVVRTYLVVW